MREWNRLVEPYEFAQLILDRQVLPDGNWDWHVFTDASENKYAAIVYVTMRVKNNIYSSITYAKNRLMAIKPTTVPKAE